MRTLDVAGKDLARSIRSASFLAFGFVVPFLTSALFYFAFGGMATGDGGFTVPSTAVQVVNLDQALPQSGGFSAGQVLVDVLGSQGLAGLIQMTKAGDPAAARAAVDRQEAAVAIVIPANFTAAALAADGQAIIELYQDPTLTLGPGIVKGIVGQVVDGFAGSQIAVQAASQALQDRGVPVDEAMAVSIAGQYARWAESQGQAAQAGSAALLQVRSPTETGAQAQDLTTGIVSMIMAGMLVFYVFFTGAASAQSLLQEEEAGTLRRLFTTPAPISAILGGRMLATYVLLAVQVTVLIVLSALIFGIDWGSPFAAVVVALSLIVLSAGFGLFLTSLLKNTRQGGMIYGGLMTIMGMLGMISIFTANVPGAAGGTFDVASLFVPQGWAVRAWSILLDGGGAADVLPTVAVMLLMGAAFFGIGLLRFRRRYA